LRERQRTRVAMHAAHAVIAPAAWPRWERGLSLLREARAPNYLIRLWYVSELTNCRRRERGPQQSHAS